MITSAKYVIGIDLGTTNSVLAYAPLDADQPRLELLPIPQLVAPATVESRSMLPSFLYLANPHEAGGGALDLPWAARREFAVGEFARRQGAEMPDRTVAAAKSWLCHSRVDRRQPILPWNAPAAVPKVSPVTASQRYLEHLRGGVGSGPSGRPDGRAARRVDRARLVRRQRPRADARGRPSRRAARRAGVVGRAAGGRLRLAGQDRRALAAAARGRRHAAGVRRGRRNHRPDAWSASRKSKAS